VNPLLIPVLAIGAGTFALGWRLAARPRSRGVLAAAFGLGFVVALPALLFAAYYLHVFDTAAWFYEFRALPGTELAAGPAGFLAGMIHGLVRRHDRLRKIAGTTLLPLGLLILLAAPYLKMIVRPLDAASLRDRWSGDVCLQSTSHTCGPAAAATLLRRFGIAATERELAETAYTSASGTEVWYLARELRRRGLGVRFVQDRPQPDALPAPALAGTRLGGPNGIGHFIAILDGPDGRYIVGDPLIGRMETTRDALRQRYYLTGFFAVITKQRNASP